MPLWGVDELLDNYKLQFVDVLKVDAEGEAEWEEGTLESVGGAWQHAASCPPLQSGTSLTGPALRKWLN